MEWISKFFSEFFSSKTPMTNYQKVVKKRRYVSEVVPGQAIQIEWSRIVGRFGYVTCLNNDQVTKKILLEMNWSDGKKEKLLLNYHADELKDFHLLNEFSMPEQKSDIDILKEELQKALDESKFERAAELRDQINKLSN